MARPRKINESAATTARRKRQMDALFSQWQDPGNSSCLPGNEFLTTRQVSARYAGAVTVGTLRNWRSLKRGPPFVNVGRRVMYRISDLVAWEKVNTVHDERA